jgi:hypothetical protein
MVLSLRRSRLQDDWLIVRCNVTVIFFNLPFFICPEDAGRNLLQIFNNEVPCDTLYARRLLFSSVTSREN